MQEVLLIIITALISGLLATIVTLYWQQRMALHSKKMHIFETLMAYRYMISSQESVHALNAIEVIYYKDKAVRKAFSDFLAEADKPMGNHPQLEDKHLKLLEEMAKALKLDDIHWDDIKRFYYPISLAQKNQDEEMLRKIQLQNAISLTEE